jgi:hypothetical protein
MPAAVQVQTPPLGWMIELIAGVALNVTLVLVNASPIIRSVTPMLMKRAAKEPWAMGVFCYAPYGMPLDHPSLEPYWALAEENDLALRPAQGAPTQLMKRSPGAGIANRNT